MKEVYMLKKWNFALGETKECLQQGREVVIPHTWNVESGTEETRTNGWYEHTFFVPEEWKGCRIRVVFQAVYHSAVVWMNGKQAGSHDRSGYTPFEIELTDYVKWNEENVLTVRANNEYSAQILPYMRSFDWANDGGIIREVRLEVTGKAFLEECIVTAKPVIIARGKRQDEGYAVFGLEASVNAAVDVGVDISLEWQLCYGCDGQEKLIYQGTQQCEGETCVIENQLLSDISYWHFDHPVLYTFKAQLYLEGQISDEKTVVFGFRDFHVEGIRFYLNGEYVRVSGMEWMPGSNPSYGMAEPKEQLKKMIRILKESNCVFTRFHWQQDDAVFDWCDRHGMLVQEEVPFWGANPKAAEEVQWDIFMQQIQEMVRAHRNHPSIIAWGVGNELDAQNDDTIQYIKDAVAYVHELDESRTANYVSNTYFIDPYKDGVKDSDTMMINDYMGTWHPKLDQHETLQKILKAVPGKPLVPSEFGLCEPAFSGGDVRRKQIFVEKMTAYRCYESVAGTIYFCLNDYRTQMGEEGVGKLRQRVHGSTDLFGNPKPSYWTVQKECAPFIVYSEKGILSIVCRTDLPSYELRGYYGIVLDDQKNEIRRIEIPNVCPGESFCVSITDGIMIAMYRRNGDAAGIFQLQNSVRS